MNSTYLKLIAAFIMLIDHTGSLLFPGIITLRIIGRIAMPIFAYQVSVSIKHTSDLSRYCKRLFMYALISQIVTVVAFKTMRLNILFTFLLSVIIIDLVKRGIASGSFMKKTLVFLIYGFMFLTMDGKYFEYGRLVLYLVTIFYYLGHGRAVWVGVLLPAIFYFFYNFNLQFYMILSIPILLIYNDSILNKINIPKRFFYLFYPLHLVVLIMIKGVMK